MPTPIECTAVEGHPQQIKCVTDGMVFSSQFDGGNLSQVERRGRSDYCLIVGAEAHDAPQCTWFSFSISTSTERRVSLHIKNLNNQLRLYGEGGHRPVYKDRDTWRRVPAHEWGGCSKTETGCTLRFRHKLIKGTTFFAFCFPYSYEEVQQHVKDLEERYPMSVRRSLLCYSALERRVDILTVGNEPLEDFVMSDDPVAKTLRDTIIFKFVPMLNPDGVYLGKYRTNSFGHNLNRFYSNPGSEHEAIGPLKELSKSLPSLAMYMDFHGHANKRGAFCYGNSLSEARLNECHEFMKHIASYSTFFDASICNFNPSNVTVKDKRCSRDETTQGSSRVQMHAANPHLTHSYTLEAHYATDLRSRPLGPAAWENIGEAVSKAIVAMDFPSRVNCKVET